MKWIPDQVGNDNIVMSTRITAVHAHEILDSRGNPTVSVTVVLDSGARGVASVPSGASTGVHEALELRDNDPKRYRGMGVKKAVSNVNTKMRAKLIGMDATAQREIDEAMIALDGTPNKSKLGANAVLGVSLAVARAAANSKEMPLYKYLREAFGLRFSKYQLPYATMNVLNGGVHAGWSIDFQESMIVPMQKKFAERVRCGSEVFHALAGILKAKKFATTVGDEGGFAPRLKRNVEVFELIMAAIKKAGYKPGAEVCIGMDPASSEFFDIKSQKYILKADKKRFTATEMVDYYKQILKKYPVIFLEDGCAEDDWAGWKILTEELGSKLALVGDDLFVTNVKRLRMGIELGVANAVLIKLNQIGSLSETMDTILLAKQHNYKVIISHRSGETPDTTISDLAVAVNAEFIKTGSMSRGERVAKYNRLMEIAEEVGG